MAEEVDVDPSVVVERRSPESWMFTPDSALDLFARVLADIAPEVDVADAEPDAHLQEELGLDSMDSSIS